jgi:hypothetical protein
MPPFPTPFHGDSKWCALAVLAQQGRVPPAQEGPRASCFPVSWGQQSRALSIYFLSPLDISSGGVTHCHRSTAAGRSSEHRDSHTAATATTLAPLPPQLYTGSRSSRRERSGKRCVAGGEGGEEEEEEGEGEGQDEDEDEDEERGEEALPPH